MKDINHKSRMAGCLSTILLSMFCLMGCGQDEKIGLDPTDNIAPGIPTDISVENINGGAIISYTAPKDDDLLCVVATYMINGIERITKASPYTNKLKVEGFGEEKSYQVALKSVDKSKNESSSVQVTVNPTTPPVKAIFTSLKVEDSFGGVKLSWKNPTEANIIVESYEKKADEWVALEKGTFYSSTKEGAGTIRGYDPKPVTFRFRIRDRWDNYSDYMETNNTPIEEIEIDKSKFKEITKLPGDVVPMSRLPIRNIWDGDKVKNCFHAGGTDGIGMSITFDMGQVAKLSRFKMWQRTESEAWIYSHNNLKHYIVYGCTEITEAMRNSGHEGEDGKIYPDFEGWTEVLDTWCYKPSGDSGKVTNEDKEYILNGDEHEVPTDVPAVRYIRIYMIENWSGGNIPQIGEMTFWGQIINN